MPRPVLLLILLLSACKSYSQITVSKPQAQRILDSLAALPLVRQEANSYKLAANSYQLAADSSARAAEANRQAFLSESAARTSQGLLLDNETAKYTRARAQATRRGVLNVVLAAALVALGYLAVTH